MPLNEGQLANMNPRYHRAVLLLAQSKTLAPEGAALALAEAQLEATLALLENATVRFGGIR